MKNSILYPAIIGLIKEERYYAELLFRSTKEISTEIDTLGIKVDFSGVTLKRPSM